MANVLLICEGQTDIRVLNTIIAQRLGKDVTIQLAGGDSGLRSVAAYERKKGQYGKVVTIEDRNYKSRQDAANSWTPNSDRLIWHRHEIENYLLKPEVLWDSVQSIPKRQNASTLPQNLEAVRKLLEQLARDMLEDHAGWLTHSHLVTLLNGLQLQLSGLSSGLHNRNDWLTHFNNESSRLDQATRRLIQMPELQGASISQFYDETLNTLRQAEFFADEKYVEDLRGKELLDRFYNAIQGALRIKHGNNSKQTPKQAFYDKLIDSLGKLYQPNYFIPDDFAELANHL